jgi:hypothetical protein
VENGVPAGQSQDDTLRDVVWKLRTQYLRKAGDLLTMELLDEAWSAEWRESAGTEPGQSREERAAAAWGIYRRWAQGDR